MHEHPTWHDESFAGSLFPHARPIPTKWVTGDYQPVGTVEQIRAREQAATNARHAKREQESSPEAEKARWQAAKQQARIEMRRERRQERIAAGIEAPRSALADVKIELHIDPEVLAGLNASFSAFASAFNAMAAPAATAISRSVCSMRDMNLGISAVDAQRLQVVLSQCAEPTPTDTIARLQRLPERGRQRERYLPGTRHNKRR